MADTEVAKNKVGYRQIIAVTLISAIYLIVSFFIVGFKPDEFILALIFNISFYLSPITRKFILGFSIFIVYWIIFDYMKAFPNYNFSNVHIADLYQWEKHLFGIHYKGTTVTPNEYWQLNGITALDIASGIFYLCWIPVPLAFAAYLFFTRKKQFLLFSLTFVLVNFLGFIVYYVFPAAPPWYVEYHGFVLHPLTAGSTAGLAKFDAYFHINVFKSIYSRGSNVFAAMPSLHSAYPVVVLYYGLRNRLGIINIFFIIVMAGIWFTAVYASHHYVLDVLAGIVCAIAGISIFNLFYLKSSYFHKIIHQYQLVIS